MNGDRSPEGTRATLYAAVALGAAMLIGGAAGYMLGRDSFSKRAAPDGRQVTSEMTMLGVSRSRLLDSLDLTPSQRLRVESLLDGAAERADSAVDRLMTDVRAVTEAARREIRSVLDDRQRARFDALLSSAPPVRMRTPVPPRRP